MMTADALISQICQEVLEWRRTYIRTRSCPSTSRTRRGSCRRPWSHSLRIAMRDIR